MDVVYTVFKFTSHIFRMGGNCIGVIDTLHFVIMVSVCTVCGQNQKILKKTLVIVASILTFCGDKNLILLVDSQRKNFTRHYACF